MKKFNKILIALLVFCLAAGALVACSPAEDTNTDNTSSTNAAPSDTTSTGAPAYKFTVVFEDTNKPAKDVKVQLCDGDLCIVPVAAGEDGVVNYELGSQPYGVYEIHIMENSIPEGYTFDNTAFKTDAETKEYTLVLKKKCDHNFVKDICTNCGEAKAYDYTLLVRYSADVEDFVVAGKGIAGVSIVITDGSQIIAQGKTDEKGEFTFNAKKYVSANEITGYEIKVQGGLPEGYIVQEDSPSFVVNSYSCAVDVIKEILPDPFTAFNPEKVKIGADTHFVLPEQRVDDGEGSDDSLYYFCVQPKKKTDVGYYSITLSNIPEGVTLYIGHYASNHGFVASTSRNCTTTDKSLVLNFIMEEKYMVDSTGAWTYDNYWLFGIRAEGEAQYPLEFDLKVEKVRDLIPGVDYVIKESIKPTIVAGLTKAENVTGKQLRNVKLALDEAGNVHVGSAAGVEAKAVLGDDGYYHLGTKSGPVLMLNLKNNNPIFGSEDGDVSFLTINSLSGTENLLTSEQLTIDGKSYNRVTYYSQMLESYGELCNDDGVYPLNEQLYNFLTLWVKQRVSGQHVSGYGDQAYMLALSYYA